MLADPRSQALTDNFAEQWLFLRNLKSVAPNLETFPDFDDNLRQAMKQETKLFFESIVREDRNVMDLLNADYTFVNERLARHYGIPGVYGSQFRRIKITDDARRGLLDKPASPQDRVPQPDLRSNAASGSDQHPGTPPTLPAHVPELKESADGRPRCASANGGARSNAVCAGCHKVMDLIGFARKSDAIGRWRATMTEPNRPPVRCLTGAVDGPVALRQMLTSRPETSWASTENC
jgi:hypothetical protein